MQRRLIEEAGRACVHALLLALTYEKVGLWIEAADCYDQAEHESRLAFAVAECRHG